jgi:hypothetical protein
MWIALTLVEKSRSLPRRGLLPSADVLASSGGLDLVRPARTAKDLVVGFGQKTFMDTIRLTQKPPRS